MTSPQPLLGSLERMRVGCSHTVVALRLGAASVSEAPIDQIFAQDEPLALQRPGGNTTPLVGPSVMAPEDAWQGSLVACPWLGPVAPVLGDGQGIPMAAQVDDRRTERYAFVRAAFCMITVAIAGLQETVVHSKT